MKYLLLLLLLSSAFAGEFVAQISRDSVRGQAFMVETDAVPEGKAILTVGHLFKFKNGDYVFADAIVNGETVKMLAICIESDLALMEAGKIKLEPLSLSVKAQVNDTVLLMVFDKKATNYAGKITIKDMDGYGPCGQTKLWEITSYYRMGFSGAPIVSADGKLVGMTCAGYTTPTGSIENDHGLFTSAARIKQFLAEVKAKKKAEVLLVKDLK